MALQNAEVAFLMGARFNWIFHFGQPQSYAPDLKVIQLDIAPEEIGHNKAPDVALVGPRGRAAGPPEDRPWRRDPRLRGDRAN